MAAHRSAVRTKPGHSKLLTKPLLAANFKLKRASVELVVMQQRVAYLPKGPGAAKGMSCKRSPAEPCFAGAVIRRQAWAVCWGCCQGWASGKG